jgi:predicted DNA-binding ribbon-helix-helix protein
MKQGVLNIINIWIDGHRTSVKLTDVQRNVAEELASFRDMKLPDYLAMLAEASRDVDKNYGRSMGIRDGIIMELYQILCTTLQKQNKKVLN